MSVVDSQSNFGEQNVEIDDEGNVPSYEDEEEGEPSQPGGRSFKGSANNSPPSSTKVCCHALLALNP